MPDWPFLTLFNARLAIAWRDALVSAVAAGIAWVLAVWLLGHPHPLFAAVSAIVCLSPGLPSHGRQAIGVMMGVATGIVVGELSLMLPEGVLVPEGLSLLRLLCATMFSMLIAACFGQPAVVPIQAGVSAVLVLALGAESAGFTRMEDVAIGVVVGLAFSQVLLTPDPVRMIDTAADELLLKLSIAFHEAGAALENGHNAVAEAALARFSAAHENLIALDAGIDAARYAARWSLRGRLAATAVANIAARYDRRAIRLYASCLLFGEAFENALRKNPTEAPDGLLEAIQDISARCQRLAGRQPVSEERPLFPMPDKGSSVEWQFVCTHLANISDVLSSLERIRTDAPVSSRNPS
ncbi:FUSC family protein [Ochrobactrum soli]|uniref:Integral membrane bound transporter domain-containing protein n=1 Tax=Ochrobactrum soli TaxID=2448455 RepID=A0A2P9HF48_9HYPH|nr:FUSC family protein [[Ochrobactrum] soli]SPL62722.1 hypothetical protein OHAE_5329 [[Ochrobactrum] soli]